MELEAVASDIVAIKTKYSLEDNEQDDEVTAEDNEQSSPIFDNKSNNDELVELATIETSSPPLASEEPSTSLGFSFITEASTKESETIEEQREDGEEPKQNEESAVDTQESREEKVVRWRALKEEGLYLL